MAKLQNKKWHRLDNTANLFPVIVSHSRTNVFRMTATLKENVIPENLQQALNDTLPNFPNFSVRLKNGLFWAYLETSNAVPQVSEEKYLPCRYIDCRARNSLLFRVLYFEKNIHLEVFHVLTDGTGALRFLKALCYRYLQISHTAELEASQLETIYGLEGAFNTQDGYMKNYTKAKKAGYKDSKAYIVKGEIQENDEFSINHAQMSVVQLKKLCKEKECSITQYFTARIAYGIYCDCFGKLAHNKPINIFVPVNLRKIFGTDTSLNFFASISANVLPDKAGMTFDDFLQRIKQQFEEKLTKEKMQEKLAFTAGSQNNLAVRFIPLFFKKIILNVVYRYSLNGSTMSFSNIGIQTVEKPFEKYFEGFRFLLCPSDRECITCSAITYGDTLEFTLASRFESTLLQQLIFRGIADDGIDITLEENSSVLGK